MSVAGFAANGLKGLSSPAHSKERSEGLVSSGENLFGVLINLIPLPGVAHHLKQGSDSIGDSYKAGKFVTNVNPFNFSDDALNVMKSDIKNAVSHHNPKINTEKMIKGIEDLQGNADELIENLSGADKNFFVNIGDATVDLAKTNWEILKGLGKAGQDLAQAATKGSDELMKTIGKVGSAARASAENGSTSQRW